MISMECTGLVQQVKTIDLLTFQEIREIYRKRVKHDFPANEVKPFFRIEKAFRGGRYLCYGARSDDDILAYAFFVRTEDMYLLDYYAVKKELRGSGIGSGFLRELGRSCFREASCVLLEVDDPAFAGSEEKKKICERRLAFYIRNGILDTGARARTFGANFLILEFPSGQPHSVAEAAALYSRIYRSTLPKLIFEHQVKIL